MTRDGNQNRDLPESITGVQLMRGEGVAPAQGFWADAWAQVIKRPGAVLGLVWIGVVAFFGVFAPIIANHRPLIYRVVDPSGVVGTAKSPLLWYLTSADIALLAFGIGAPLVLFAPLRSGRSARLGLLIAAAAQTAVSLVLIGLSKRWMVPDRAFAGALDVLDRLVPQSMLAEGVRVEDLGEYIWTAIVALVVAGLFTAVPSTRTAVGRVGLVLVVAAVSAFAGGWGWVTPLQETRYAEEIAAGRATARFTIIPFSPSKGSTELNLLKPLSPVEGVAETPVFRGLAKFAAPGEDRLDVKITPGILAEIEGRILGSGLENAKAEALAAEARARFEGGRLPDGRAVIDLIRSRPGPRFVLGTDAFGQDALSQMLHACRLSISIGLVSTGLAVLIGVTMGSLMGYFGGFVDLVLYRVVEVFMAVPLLFLLIVAAGVLPDHLRTTYTMMAIIGCFTWTGAARFTRAEFLKLRSQDFVQSARAVGLPLRSVLFKHMLPNGVTPVLVEASFGVAFAITIEATLSFLGLGPVDQASWGRLLASAYNQVGTFQWWLAVFPGAAIFLTVLSYNLIGEALRDAIDPKLKKARV